MAGMSPEVIAAARAELGVSAESIPRSVAIIMDGNGRWARSRGLPRRAGHAAGAEVVRKIVTEAVRLGLEALSLYSFSIENWQRPAEEVQALMELYATYLVRERPTLLEHDIRFRHLGRRDKLPPSVLREIDESLRISRDAKGMFLALALNYGSRAEITDSVRRIARKVADGTLQPDAIDEAVISSHLDSAGVPDPDLLIRTSGELRLSNFLLWQLSYAEFYVTDVYWPDFNETEFRKGIIAYAERHRRFGRVDGSNV